MAEGITFLHGILETRYLAMSNIFDDEQVGENPCAYHKAGDIVLDFFLCIL